MSARRSLALPLALLAVLVLALAAAWWFLVRDPGEDVAAPQPPVTPRIEPAPPVQAAATPDRCTADALGALEGGFAVIEPALRDCGGALSADEAFALVEEYALRSDAAALLLFGMLYDVQAQDPQIKDVIGLKLEPDAAKAVDYYARAVKSGSQAAQSRLAATCDRLAGSSSTLDKGAFNDFCK